MITSALPCDLLHLGLPLEVLLGAGLGLLVLQVIFLAVDEQHDVGVLLDRAGFAQVGELRPLVVAVLDLAGELRQRDDRDLRAPWPAPSGRW